MHNNSHNTSQQALQNKFIIIFNMTPDKKNTPRLFRKSSYNVVIRIAGKLFFSMVGRYIGNIAKASLSLVLLRR